MHFPRLTVFVIGAVIVIGCFASLDVSAGRIKGTPLRIPPAQNPTHTVVSTGGVAVYPGKGTRIRAHGTTSCSVDQTGDYPLIYCQGETHKTHLTLTGASRSHRLEIQADAITQIEDASTACRISTGEDNNPRIHCDSPPKDIFPSRFPQLNGWMRAHCRELRTKWALTPPLNNEPCEDSETSQGLQIHIEGDDLPDSADRHRITVIPGKERLRHRCNVCQRSLQGTFALKRHIRTHTGERPYACDWDSCDKRFITSQQRDTHKRTHTGEKPYTCDWDGCDKRFITSQQRDTHKRTHTGEKPYTCDWDGCDRRFITLQQRDTHKRTHTGEKPYACDWDGCDQRFARTDHLTIHKRTHTGEKPFACDWDGCDKRFTTAQQRDIHKRTHTGEKPFACDWDGCDKRFADLSTQVKHKRTHTGEKPYACDWDGCDKRFTTAQQRDTHKRTHTGEKPYACDWGGCDKRFADLSTQVKHKRTHTREKPYACDWDGCDKRFADPGNQVKHKRTHTGEKPYACDWGGCNQCFARADYLTTHKRTHTGEKPYVCDCGKSYTQSHCLNHHEKKNPTHKKRTQHTNRHDRISGHPAR